MAKLSPTTRSRIRAAAMLAVLVALAGVAVWGQGRYWWLPGSVKAGAGNILWAGGTFCLIAMIRPGWTTRSLALLTLLLAWTVEASQWFHVGTLETIRGYAVGRAVLGTTFDWADIVALTAGVVMAAGLDVLARPQKTRRR